MVEKVSFKEKIKQEILKSGYPLEFFCLQNLKDWGLIFNKQYVSDNGDLREIDLNGYLQDSYATDQVEVTLQTNLLIECKKNLSNPWVFFKEPICPAIPNLAIRPQTATKKFNRVDLMGTIKEHLYNTNENKCRTYMLPFVHEDKKESRQIYDSVIKLIDCFRFQSVSRNKLVSTSETGKPFLYLDVYYLTIVFDGQLFIADLLKEEVDIQDTNHIVLFVSRSESEGLNNYTLDVVHKDHFAEYLVELRKDHSFFKEYMLSQDLLTILN
jgi:hypothetical protein